MWLLWMSIRSEGHHFRLPLPIFFIWPVLYLLALLAMILPSRLRLDQRRAIASNLGLPFRLGGALVNVKSRDGVQIVVRFI